MNFGGLACHPTNPDVFVTAGDDKSIRMWDAERRRLTKRVQIDSMTRAVSFSPDGTMLGAGLGGSVGRGRGKKDGAMIVLSTESLSIVHQVRDSRNWITETKFSPDGETFAIGSRDNKIYLYDVTKEFALKGKCEKHNNFITQFDFSSDSMYIQSNCGGYELLYATTMDGEHVNSASTLKDVNWETWTCPLGWPVQGIWPEYNDGVDINACDRTHAASAEAMVDRGALSGQSGGPKLLAVANGVGEVKVYRYPVLNKNASCIEGRGHADAVTKVRFTCNDKRMITLGGPERAILQWKVIKTK